VILYAGVSQTFLMHVIMCATFSKVSPDSRHYLCHSNVSRWPRSGSTGTSFHFPSLTMETLKRLHGSPEKVRFPSSNPMPLETSKECSHKRDPKNGPISVRSSPVFSSSVQPSSVTQHGHRSQPPNQQPHTSFQKLVDKQEKVLLSISIIPPSDPLSTFKEGIQQPFVMSSSETLLRSVRLPSVPSLPPIPSRFTTLVDLPIVPPSVKIRRLASSRYYLSLVAARFKSNSRVSPGTLAYRLIRWVWKVPWN
jgi:hypothetical protein